MVNEANIRRFVTNLFAYPVEYFQQHTADELHISEDDRRELIRLQNERTDGQITEYDRVKEFKEEMLDDFAKSDE